MGDFKHDLFAQFARVAKAMSNGNRLELLEFLAQGEYSVDALARVSGHLSQIPHSIYNNCARQAWLTAASKGRKCITGWAVRM